jgi:DMSO/TMAO reductase YedYZ molybdopterin-dependent catalytic subunit
MGNDSDPQPDEVREISDRSASEIDSPAQVNTEAEAVSTPCDPASEEATTMSSAKAEPKRLSFAQRLRNLAEQHPKSFVISERDLRGRTRRDFVIYGLGTVAAAAAAGFLLPSDTLRRFGFQSIGSSPLKENFFNKVLAFDDEVAKYMYSPGRLLPTYTRSQITELRNNYNGATPDPGYIPDWKLTLKGLASGTTETLTIQDVENRFAIHDQITRLVCVEGWSGIGWWAGIRFDDLLRAYPPLANAKWARLDSSVNLDDMGNPDPYYVSIDLPTARHPQTLLAIHQNGQPLTVEHGAPLRLLAPMKLGLKNIKAITQISYSVEEPKDYWAVRGYSRYDGI